MSNIKIKTSDGKEEVISPENLVAILPPTPSGTPSRVIHVEATTTESEPLPKLKISETTTATTPPSPTTTIKLDPQNTHIIVSTKSGTEQASQFYTQTLSPFLTALLPDQQIPESNIHFTTSATSIKDLTTSTFHPLANSGVSLTILLLSGDGGTIDLLNTLSFLPRSPTYKPPTISLFPLGTGNALAHSIRVTKDSTYGLSTLAHGTPRPLPIFRATFSPGSRILVNEARDSEQLPKDANGKPTLYGAVVLSWGMHASLVADSDTTEYRKFGVERFKMAAKEALYPASGADPHAYKARVSVLRHGESKWHDLSREEHMYVLATLVSNLEKTFVISPASEPLDGHLRLVHFGPTSGDEAMRIMGLAYQGGKHVEDPAVGYEDLQGLRIRFEGREDDARWRRICVDGTIVRLEEDGWVQVEVEKSNVLDVLCPAN